LAKVAPLTWLQFSAGKFPGEMADMFVRSDPEFIRAMCLAIFEWEGLGETSTRVLGLHGRFDHVIPPPANPDLLLNGGHVIAMSHPRECTDFIHKHLS
jgi:pimeloyl-ACP methyl ester carboxylesterase